MVVKLDDARIEVEIDVREAIDDLGQIESRLDRAKARRSRGVERVDPGRDSRIGVRRAGAAAALGRAAGGGIRGAVRFAAKLGAGLTIAEIIRQSPAILPAILGEETMRQELIKERDLIPEFTLPQSLPIPGTDTDLFSVFGLDALRGKKFFEGSEIPGVTIQEVVESLGKKIAEIEGILKTTVKAATLAYDLLNEGKLAEAGASAILEIRRAISPSSQSGQLGDETKGVGGPLGFTEEVGSILDSVRAYNTAEARFKQRAVGARFGAFLENQQQGFRAAGGGVSK